MAKTKTKPPRPELERLGASIKRARDEAGIDQKGLAELLDVTQQTVAQWEGGQIAVSVDRLPTLAAKLKTTVGRLFGESALADESQLVSVHNLLMPIEAARLGQQWAEMEEPARSLYRDLIYLIVAAQKRQPEKRKKARGKAIGIEELLQAVKDVDRTVAQS